MWKFLLLIPFLLTSCFGPSYVQRCPYSSDFLCDSYYQNEVDKYCDVDPNGRECKTYKEVQHKRTQAKQEGECYDIEWCPKH
jgi:hypothetical protein